MARIALIARSSNSWSENLLSALLQIKTTQECDFAEATGLCGRADASESETSYIYIPSLTDRAGMMPDLSEADWLFQQVANLRPRQWRLLASALISVPPTPLQNLSTDYSFAP